MSYLKLSNIRKRFGETEIIKGIDLDIEQGEFIVFVGPSGCGKSTLLRLIAGLESVSEGTLTLDGRDITHLPSGQRDLAMVFQSYALYPHMTVFDNMSFALKLAGTPKDEIRRKVEEAARTLNLSAYLKHTPRELSGGQRQRVAIGRAIVRAPKVFLFDEPLSNLDAALRGNTRVEIHRLHKALGATTIYVTHDQVEAMTLADRVVVLNGGRIEQAGSPLTLYDQPTNRFVAQFIGMPPMNMLPAHGVPALAATTGGQLPADGLIGVRPEAVIVRDTPGEHSLTGRLELIESLGSDTLLYVRAGDQTIVSRQAERPRFNMGDTVHLHLDPARLHRFDAQGQALDGPQARAVQPAPA
ncbi:MAG: sn-glycerol-3-phosphate ABC transporter ATP-binding protein UgpC [Lautropia sp.]|nr:sn-glycerol-3-phosphate ABC transporter ATP-binding protein UgpC [Lautropia sp.]